MLKSIFRRILSTKSKVQRGANFDKINLEDEVRVRSPQVKSIVDRTARIYIKQVLGIDETAWPRKYDTNQRSRLELQEFSLVSVERNPAANLLSIEILEDDAESIELLDRHIRVHINTTPTEESDHDSVKALIEGNPAVAALISVEINDGEGATEVTASGGVKFFTGAVG